MVRARPVVIALLATALLASCGGGGGALPPGGGDGGGGGGGGFLPVFGIPQVESVETDDGPLAPEFAAALPFGSKVTFIGDEIRLRGSDFTEDTRVFFGMNNDLAQAEDSLLTTPLGELPADPFVYTDPDEPGLKTILEVEAAVRYVAADEILVTIPDALACSRDFSPAAGPLLRLVDDAGSSRPKAAGLFLVGPRFLALTPDRGPDRGGFPVTIHGQSFSPRTQVAIRYVDPATGATRILGDADPTNGAVPGRPIDDIDERFLNSETLLVARWPGLPAGGGVTDELSVDLLLFENIDTITSDEDLEPDLGGESACDPLRPEGAVQLEIYGVRNAERDGVFVYEPTAVSGSPVLDRVSPAAASEFGGDVVLLVGRRFDEVTADLDDPGIRIECPPGSGLFQAPLRAVLLDSGTLAVTLPPCAVDLAQPVDIALRNRFTLDRFPAPSLVVFEDALTIQPTPAAAAPAIDAVWAADVDAAPYRRFFVLGARFDAETEAGGVTLLLPDDEIEAARVLRHGPGLLEVYLPRLGALDSDVVAGLRVRNTVGSADADDILTLRAIAGGTAALTAVEPASGRLGGGNDVVLTGTGFSPATAVKFGSLASPRVTFVSATKLIARVPVRTTAGTVAVTVDGAGTADYAYDAQAGASRPWLAGLDHAQGGAAGGYAVLLRGAHLTAATEVRFGGTRSPRVDFLDATCLRVVVPAGTAGEVDVTVTDPLLGSGGNTSPFLYVADPTPTLDDAVLAGRRALAAGSGFDADTVFLLDDDELEDPMLLAPGVAALRLPADGSTLEVRSSSGSDTLAVTIDAIPAPVILAVRSLSGDRLALIGEGFVEPLTVTLGDDTELTGDDLTILGDDRLAFTLPEELRVPGPLAITVTTASGSAAFETETGAPGFEIEPPQAPVVDAVTPGLLYSDGGERVVLSGRHFTDTTAFAMRTTAMAADTWRGLRGVEVLSGTVAVGFAPALPGGMPPAGLPGAVRATETDTDRADAIDGDPFTVTDRPDDPPFRVVDAAAPVLLAVVPEHGSIDGAEPVLLLGSGFLDGTGRPGIDSVTFVHPDLGPVAYERVSPADAPLLATPANEGRFLVIDDTTILLITNGRPPIPVSDTLAVDVEVRGTFGASRLLGAFVYENTPAVRTPVLRGITPNETRLNGGTTHLLAGGFLTEADRLVLTRPSDGAQVTIDTDTFAEVNDFFVTFAMPDLRGTFVATDRLDVHLEKDVPELNAVRVSNVLPGAVYVSFAGPPTIDVPEGVAPGAGSSFGGEVVTIKGTFFTTNTRVLFGTIPAPVVFVQDEHTLLVIAPTLPIDAPGNGLDLLNVHETSRDRTIDLAVFNQGGWAVLEDAFTWETEAPEITGMTPTRAIEGSTTRVTITGERFLPGTTVTPRILNGDDSLAGTVSNVVVRDFETLEFDYTAATPDEPTYGPLRIVFDVETNHGSATSPEFLVELSPFVTKIVREDGEGDVTVPTTGIESGSRVVFVVEGGNFATGADLTVSNRVGDAIELTESDSLSGAGRFEIVSDRKLRFTAPFVFGNDSPTLIEGNPNVGPASIEFVNGNTLHTEVADAFRWVPAVMDFDSYGFTIPSGVPTDAVPHEVTVADLNNDGLPDAALMVRTGTDDLDAPEAYVFLADTFGDEDVDGDGVVPDFAGTFTRYVISDDTVHTEAGFLGRGGTVLAGNFDDDPQLELAIPAVVDGKGNVVRILIADYDADDDSWSIVARLVSEGVNSSAVGGIAVGNFDDSDDRDDIAAVVEDIAKTKRRLTIWTSDGDYSFGQFSVDLPGSVAGGRVGFLTSGNFDGQGLDELIWGLSDGESSLTEEEYPVVVATIQPSTESVTLKPLTNFTGGQIHDIAVFDHDGDGKESAALIVQDEVTWNGTHITAGGIAIALEPLSGKVSSYVQTAFKSNGRALGVGDLDADGLLDLVAGNTNGEFIVLIGNSDGTFDESSGSWYLPTIPETFDTRIESLRVADLNNDGLAEVWIGDIGASPTSLKIFANASR